MTAPTRADQPPKMPERIRVGPFRFAVLADAASIARVRFDGNDGMYAQTDVGHLTITLDASLPRDQIRDSLLHETLHAVIWAAGGWPKGLTQEDAIKRYSSLLLDTLQRNPTLVRYLVAEDGAA